MNRMIDLICVWEIEHANRVCVCEREGGDRQKERERDKERDEAMDEKREGNALISTLQISSHANNR